MPIPKIEICGISWKNPFCTRFLKYHISVTIKQNVFTFSPLMANHMENEKLIIESKTLAGQNSFLK